VSGVPPEADQVSGVRSKNRGQKPDKRGLRDSGIQGFRNLGIKKIEQVLIRQFFNS
jgi:hypothetical protein